jgi:ketosteroid isomerase-like protein
LQRPPPADILKGFVAVKKTLLALFVLTVALGGVSRAQTVQGDDHAQILALEQRFAQAFRAKSVDAIMKVYQPGHALFVFDVTPPREHVGYADYRKDWQDTFGLFKGTLNFAISELHVVTDGTLGYGRSIQHLWGTMKDRQPLDITVRVTDDYQKIRRDVVHRPGARFGAGRPGDGERRPSLKTLTRRVFQRRSPACDALLSKSFAGNRRLIAP